MRKILGVFEFFLGIAEKTKEKNDRENGGNHGSVNRGLHTVQARERSTNPDFWIRMSSGGVGVFHVNGWGQKVWSCPSKPRETKLLGGIFGEG